MSDVLTVSESKQILDAIQGLSGQVLALRGDFQAMDKKLDLHIVKTEEQFKLVRAEINTVRTELKAEIQAVRSELKADIQAVDAKVDSLGRELRDAAVELRSQ